MVTRRRYDTVALVRRMRRERRSSLLVATGGFVFFTALFVFLLGGLGGSEIPRIPESASPAPTKPQPKTAPAMTVTRPPEPTDAPDTPIAPTSEKPSLAPNDKEVVADARYVVVLSKKLGLWIDSKKIGRVKKHKGKLSPGTHVFATRVRKKTVKVTVDAKAGGVYRVSFDHTKLSGSVEAR